MRRQTLEINFCVSLSNNNPRHNKPTRGPQAQRMK